MGQGAYIFGCEGPVLSSDEAAFFHDVDPWGFILFARNVETPDQVRKLCEDLKTSVGRNAPILMDQEGGRVQRLRAPHWREWLPPLDHARAGARAMWIRYRMIAHELYALGIDTNCAPQLDIAQPDTHSFLRNRCYGGDTHTVIEMGRAAATGLLAGGVLPVMKHIPGHGRAKADSHFDLPVVTESKDMLTATDFLPFAHLADLPMAMTAHLIYKDYDPTGPATTSADMIRVIREDIGFRGLLMTDDLSMKALSGDVTLRTRASLTAGCDLILHCNGSRDEMQQVADAAGPLADTAQGVADKVLAARKAPDPVDIPALEAELEALMKRAGV